MSNDLSQPRSRGHFIDDAIVHLSGGAVDPAEYYVRRQAIAGEYCRDIPRYQRLSSSHVVIRHVDPDECEGDPRDPYDIDWSRVADA